MGGGKKEKRKKKKNRNQILSAPQDRLVLKIKKIKKKERNTLIYLPLQIKRTVALVHLGSSLP